MTSSTTVAGPQPPSPDPSVRDDPEQVRRRSRGRWRRSAALLGTAIVIVAGLVIRVVAWWGGGSLNSDELYIAVNIQQLGFHQLAGPVLYDQIAPLGWLWLVKALYVVFGASDAVLRLPALLAGCAGVVLSAVLARRLLPAPYAIAATALVAGNPTLIQQSVQVKPYTTEAAVAVLLVLLALRSRHRGPDRRSAVRVFWLTGAAAVWFATTATFVLAGVGGVLLLLAARRRQWSLVRAHLIAAVPAVASAGVGRLLGAPVAGWVYRFWSQSYPYSLGPGPWDPAAIPGWSGDLFVGVAGSSLGVWAEAWVVPVGLLMLAGAVGLVRRSRPDAALLLAPLAVGYLLALLRLYPLGTRAGTWLVPCALIVACGVGAFFRTGSPAGLPAGRADRWRLAARAGAAVTVAVVLVGGFGPSWGRTPVGDNTSRYAVAEQAVAHVAARQRPDDLVLFERRATSTLALWYGPDRRLDWDGQLEVPPDRRCRPDSPAGARERLATAPRIWVVSRAFGPSRERTKQDLSAVLSPYGRLVERHWYGAIAVSLFQSPASPASPQSAAGPPAPPGSPCLTLWMSRQPR